MSRPLSQLIHHRIQEGSGSPRTITLHDYRQHGEDVKDYGVAAAPHGRVISLESYKGVFVGRDIVGFTWFVGPNDRPSPLFFGDALAEIERFLWDEIDRQSQEPAELPFLVGIGQGGIMALAAAAAVPDLLAGVVAIDAYLPVVPGWEPPLAPLAGLPVLLLEHDTFAPPAGDHVLHGDRLVSALTGWGGQVARRSDLSTAELLAELPTWVASQTVRHQPGATVDG